MGSHNHPLHFKKLLNPAQLKISTISQLQSFLVFLVRWRYPRRSPKSIKGTEHTIHTPLVVPMMSIAAVTPIIPTQYRGRILPKPPFCTLVTRIGVVQDRIRSKRTYSTCNLLVQHSGDWSSSSCKHCETSVIYFRLANIHQVRLGFV